MWRLIGVLISLSSAMVSIRADPPADDFASITEWREANFSDPHGLGLGNNRADPDGDKIMNLLEYALGMNPKEGDSRSLLPRMQVQEGKLQLQYNRLRSDVLYEVETTTDLKIWTNEGVDQGQGDTVETTASVPLGAQGPAFLRLRVSDGQGYVSLYAADTEQEPPLSIETEEALYTYFSDRARDRHAREDQFEAYDHYLSFYWEDRTVAVEIVDTIPHGGNTITFNVESQWKLKNAEAELRFFYRGIGTVAEYYDNKSMTPLDDTHYVRTVNYNQKEGRPIQVGDRMEFELSQFLDNPPQGRDNYYGTTYLYIVGEGLVPWETRGVFGDPSTEREDSYPIPEEGWLGGKTTLPYAYSGEPDNHFMQMATNLSHINGQPFVLGRRVHHTDVGDGSHDEGGGNPDFEEIANLLGERYINRSCVACHSKNGRALPPETGSSLSQYVVRVGDSEGNPHPLLGKVLQPRSISETPEGNVRLSEWIESAGLRTPVFTFEGVQPEGFSARIAPQLVGMGLLEAIPESILAAAADPDDMDGDGISGRLRIVTDPETGEKRVGRFGWKAGEFSVRSQVAAALNTDMGVMTSIYPNPDLGSSQVDPDSSGPELSESHLTNLTTYLSLLGVRAQRSLDDPAVIQGRQHFTQSKCTDCHTPTFQTSAFHPHAELRSQTIHPYTDLLLHDMGPGLADTLNQEGVENSEWRTAPLWGIGLTAGVSGGEAYLHDGRARTLEEAILWHGGEATESRLAYQALTEEEKAAVIKFIKSL